MKPDPKKPSRKKTPSGPESPKEPAVINPRGQTSAGGSEGMEYPEPQATSAPVPIWLIVAFGILVYACQLYLDRTSGGFHPQVYEAYANFAAVDALRPKSDSEALFARGGAVYTQACALCHQPSGLGTPGQFPPLAGSEWVLASGSDRLIRIVQNGLGGPIEVKGQQWNAQMPAIGSALPDEDVAAVITFIRQSWGNNAPAVSAEKVKAVRAQIQDRIATWTADELLQVPLAEE